MPKRLTKFEDMPEEKQAEAIETLGAGVNLAYELFRVVVADPRVALSIAVCVGARMFIKAYADDPARIRERFLEVCETSFNVEEAILQRQEPPVAAEELN